ncbi:hypothetical protein PPOP_0492 [Paenibacillus popilliae ATCC 14706]|uniref:Uncharacterized protein n=1 Tax=Paenibacillus popilliae ATCC 14706 TaxID=1212764 RepID=M9LM42_PAEPP|nr:hypothetical protein PPOP_0492 [Paenibacillus popilliae ATCC 14706]
MQATMVSSSYCRSRERGEQVKKGKARTNVPNGEEPQCEAGKGQQHPGPEQIDGVICKNIRI